MSHSYIRYFSILLCSLQFFLCFSKLTEVSHLSEVACATLPPYQRENFKVQQLLAYILPAVGDQKAFPLLPLPN